jgi:UDP-N-acetylmuramoylalanine--D-glutamate ligase
VITARAFAGKRYAVLGLARSGLAVVESLLASGAQVTAWDRQQTPRAKLEGRCTLADPMEIDLAGFDGVVVSPGVPLNTHPLADKARRAGVPVIGDIELFAAARPELPPHKVVGITGTNGKSTTTALVTHILSQAGVPALMGGNIGLPILAQDPLPAGGVYVLELSSYQIDLTHRLDCDVAVLLNITPDHLDRYDGFAAYAASKGRLFAMQTAEHVAVVSASTPEALAQVAGLAQPVIRIAAEPEDQSRWPALQGPHNLENVRCARAACLALGLSDTQIAAGLASYRSLPHRMEILADHDGVLWVNDSKATNAASTAPALAAWPTTDHARVHWICGGIAKADNLDECLPHIGNVAAAYTIGEAGPLFADLLAPYTHVERCEMLCEAADRALKAAVPGDVVLFSPACASFDQFRDYEARGDAFREIVERLTGQVAPVSRTDSRSAA